MILPPLIERELRNALRKKGARKNRMKYALVAGAITAFFLLVASLDATSFGRPLHHFLFWVGLYIAVVQTPLLTADLFCLERRNQTLGFLFLAGLSPGEVFASKVLSGALVALSNLMALVPFLAIPFFSGGLSFSLFLATVCCLPNLLLFVLALTIFASVLCDEESTALVLVAATGIGIAGLIPAFYVAGQQLSGAAPFAADWLLLSPAYGPYMIYRGFAVGSPTEFWQNAALTLMWSCLALSLAGAILKRTWQDKARTEVVANWRGWWQSWLRGSPRWRHELRRHWLDTHPFAWVCMHDRTHERLAWCSVSVIVAVWLAAFCAWPRLLPAFATLYSTAILLNGTIELIVLHAAGRRMADDRRSAAMELLLTSPLTVPQIVGGQVEAIRHQFRPVFRIVWALNLLLLLGGLLGRKWNALGLCTYVIVWTPLLLWSWHRSFHSALLAMWISLNCGRAGFAVWRVTSQWIGFVWFLFFVCFGHIPSRVASFPSGSTAEFVFVLCLALVVGPGVIAAYRKIGPIELRLLADFRLIAQTALPEPSDPRFKHWNMYERFPAEDPYPLLIVSPRWLCRCRRAGWRYGEWTRQRRQAGRRFSR